MSDSEKTVSQSNSPSISPTPVLEESILIAEPQEQESKLEQELELDAESDEEPDTESEQEELEQEPQQQPEQELEQEPEQEPEPEPEKETYPESEPEPASRLIITKIVLNNFKSYFGRRTIGPFHKCFSAIIGPNGSGKSNVIDALLFVFGRRASKIRLKRISELIHTSDNHKTCSQARVDIYFQTIVDIEQQNTNKDYKIIKDSQFIISRVATRKSQSQYLINNKTVKFAAVKELLLSKNIDLNNNRFLILQGEVESIAMMKPKGSTVNEEGLLEYLEDIIGSNVYVEKIEEAGERVEQMSTEVQEKLNRVKMVERDREKLENAKNEAEKYVKQRMQSWKLQSIQTQLNLNRFENRILSSNQNLEEINEKIDGNNEEQKEIQNEMREIEDQYQNIRQQKNILNKELEKAQNKFQECEEKDVAAQERCKYLKKEMTKMKNQEQKCMSEKEELEGTLDYNINDGIPQLLTIIDELTVNLEQESEEQQRMIIELAKNTQPIKDKMISKQRLLLPLKDDENEVKQRLNIIDDEIDDIRNKATAIHLRKQKLEEKLNDIQIQINVCKEKELGDEQQLQTYERDLHDFEHKIQELQNASSNVPLQRAEMELKEAQQTLHRNTRANYGRGGPYKIVLSAIMEAQENGNLSGIYGRLGDLATIDEKYDIAISTAAFSKLNYIVVEKVRHATRIIEYLKRCKLGRASMIVLEKQTHLQNRINGRPPLQPNSRAPALFDLISIENKRLDVVFYSILGEVLVADNLDIANDIAFGGRQRRRVVTLDGKLIEVSGTLSGGGSKQARGSMRLRNASNDNNNNNERNENPRSNKYTIEYVMQLEENVKQMHIQLNEYRKEMTSVQQQMYQCKRLVRRAGMEQRKLNTEMQGLVQREKSINEQLVHVNKQLEVFEAESKDDEQKIEQLMADKNEQNEVFVNARRRCELLEDEILILEKEILDAGGNDVRLQKTKVDQMRIKLDADEKKLITLRVQSETCEKKLRKINGKLPTFETDLHEMKVEYDTNSELRNELEEIAANVMNVLNEKKELFNAKEKEWKKLSKIVEKQQQTLTKLTKSIMNLNDQKKNIELELNSLQMKKKKYHKNIQELHKKYINFKIEFLDETLDEENEREEEKQNNDEDIEMKVNSDSDEEDDDAKNMQLDEEVCCPTTDISNIRMSVDRYLNENTLVFGMLSNEQLQEVNILEIDGSIEEYKKIIGASKVNMAAIEDYRMKDADYVRRLQDLQAYKEKAAERRQLYELLKTSRFETFMDGFSQISTKLKEMYRMLTQGGDAELNLVDSIDPFSEGVQFSVRPPKKSWKNISNLSGGEKTLSSMALVFALHIFRPTPLYVMDEIDAALDFKNVSIVASYIQNQTKNAQFIIISLRNNMFDLANRLVGIYKINNATNSITIDPHLFSLPLPMQSGNQNQSVQNDSKLLFSQALPDLNISRTDFEISEQVEEMPISLMNDLDDITDDVSEVVDDGDGINEESFNEDIDIQVLLSEQQ